MDSTGKRIKSKRAEKGYGQEELAQIMGKTSKQVISNWENNKNEPTLSDLKKLASVLGTTVSFLVGESLDPAEGNSDKITISKDEFIELQRIALRKEKEEKVELQKRLDEVKNG
jgi:transcriptional regulator with XRE-family HTH domain